MVDEKQDLSLIEQANQAALRIELATKELQEANEIKDKLLKKEEQLQNNRLLGGKSVAGENQKPELSEEQKIIQENKLAFKGTLLEGVFK